jgi:TetR/AcrR family transcriptional regulator, cholesterol catabolism regulator
MMVRVGRTVEERLENPSSRLRELIDKSAQLFYERGYDGTSVKDITDSVGILKGSLYSHVDGKDDLLFVVVNEIHDRFEQVLSDIEAMEASPGERLRAFVTQHVTIILEDSIRSRVYERYWHMLPDERKAALVKKRSHYRRRVIALIEAAQRDGAVDPTVDAQFTAILLLSAMDTVYAWSESGTWSHDDIVRHYVRVLLDGVCL